MNKELKTVLLIIFVLCNYFQIKSQESYAQTKIDTTIREAIDFELEGLDGKIINSENLKGNIVVINFWGIYCKPCVQEIPELNEIVKEFMSQNVEFIGITGDKKSDLLKFLEKNNFEYKVGISKNYAELNIKYVNFPAVPVHFIINKDWKIVYRYIGRLQGKDLEIFKKELEELL